MKTLLITGGAGFIGSAFVLLLRNSDTVRVINLDKLTYAGNILNLADLSDDPNYIFIRGDITDQALVSEILNKYHPEAVINFAAESHVDRSIIGPYDFINTNIVGTFQLLEASLAYWRRKNESPDFRFLHVSTDEVYGSLNPDDPGFIETTPYAPTSPYSASKASSDHLTRAYYHTYGLPTLITNCSNNYGPRQFPEKLIPLMILNAISGKSLPIYGDGLNVRDWLYVEDHCRAILEVLNHGRVGQTYNIGGDCERTNNEIVQTICRLVDEHFPESPHRPHQNLISHIADRPGHDRRYAINFDKIKTELGWKPDETFDTGLDKTVVWYKNNDAWVRTVQSGEYRKWIEKNYNRR